VSTRDGHAGARARGAPRPTGGRASSVRNAGPRCTRSSPRPPEREGVSLNTLVTGALAGAGRAGADGGGDRGHATTSATGRPRSAPDAPPGTSERRRNACFSVALAANFFCFFRDRPRFAAVLAICAARRSRGQGG
jgi:hypothetical protein